MQKTAKHLLVTSIVGTALFAAGAAFVPGTAEAHCGGHADTCPETYGVFLGAYCGQGFLWYQYIDTAGYCMTPAAGCSGAACANWPCEDGQCLTGIDAINHYCANSGYYYDGSNWDYDCANEVACNDTCYASGYPCAGGSGQCDGQNCVCN